ncbi:MAG: substrate-binding domain-containing protein, partial [Terriglobia bacterium]
MKTTQRRTLSVWALSIAFACVMLSSCSSNPSGQSGGQLLINVAGSTLGYPIYSKWFSQYHDLHPKVELNYASIGSGGGIQQLRTGTVDIGASD